VMAGGYIFFLLTQQVRLNHQRMRKIFYIC